MNRASTIAVLFCAKTSVGLEHMEQKTQTCHVTLFKVLLKENKALKWWILYLAKA